VVSKIAARKAELRLSNSGVDRIENNVISVCYLDANEIQNTVILIFSSVILDNDLRPESGPGYPGPWRH